MTTSILSNMKQCDECGRTVARIIRRLAGHGYCATCYQLKFIRYNCNQCNRSSRVHKNDPHPTCRHCFSQDATCFRCKKDIPIPKNRTRIGKLKQSFICKSCRINLSTEEECYQCGETTKRFQYSEIEEGNKEPICLRCSKKNFATCSWCRKYRPVKFINPEGKVRCKDCAPDLKVYHSCPGCGDNVAGKGRSYCNPCYIKIRGQKRILLNKELIHSEYLRELFEKFAQSSLITPQAGDITKKVDHYVNAFLILDYQGVRARDINQETLLSLFEERGCDIRTSYPALIEYLTSNDITAWSLEMTNDKLLQSRIKAILSESTEFPWSSILEEFYSFTKTNKKKLKYRTKISYLRAARRFFEEHQISSKQDINELNLNQFIKRNPGLKASCSSIARFSKVKITEEKRKSKSPERKLKVLLEECSSFKNALFNSTDEKLREACWLKLVSKLYCVSQENLVRLKRNQFEYSPEGGKINLNNTIIELPQELTEVLLVWCKKIKQEEFIFKAGSQYIHMHPDTINYRIKKLAQTNS